MTTFTGNVDDITSKLNSRGKAVNRDTHASRYSIFSSSLLASGLLDGISGLGVVVLRPSLTTQLQPHEASNLPDLSGLTHSIHQMHRQQGACALEQCGWDSHLCVSTAKIGLHLLQRACTSFPNLQSQPNVSIAAMFFYSGLIPILSECS